MQNRILYGIIVGLLLILMLLGCVPSADDQPGEIRVELVDGNVRRTYVYTDPISVDEFLRRVEANVSELDRVDPPRFTQIQDGMTITIVRVREEVNCREEEVQFSTRRVPINTLAAGQEQISQAGENGTDQVCERCIFENNLQMACTESSRISLKPPREQIIFYGLENNIPIVIEGQLTYVTNGQAWLLDGSTVNRRLLTPEGQLDGRVFDVTLDGRRLLYTRSTADPADSAFANELWVVLDTSTPRPIRLEGLNNILHGQWMPNQPFTISYSTAEPTENGWEAYNDVWRMRIDGNSGQTLDFESVVEQNAVGIYSYWGTRYLWSPDGRQLAWSRADSVGLVDLTTGDFITLASFAHFEPAILRGWVWQPEIAWSGDSQTLITTLHGPPNGSESPENSVIFNVAVFGTTLILDAFKDRAGIWARPRYGPVQRDASGFPAYQIAYLQARDPLNSLGGDYDLLIMDRDGSNPRLIFPPAGRPGIDPFNEPNLEFVWSPSGRYLAIIYQGDLWVVEVATGQTEQLTTDGRASRPRWTN